MFSDELLAALHRDGWFPGRKVDVALWREGLLRERILMSEEAARILESFGGLTLHPLTSKEDEFHASEICFNPELADDEEIICDWNALLGMKLSPLGEVGGMAFLYVNEFGAIIGIWSGGADLYGATFIEAMENSLMRGRRLPTVLADGDGRRVLG